MFCWYYMRIFLIFDLDMRTHRCCHNLLELHMRQLLASSNYTFERYLGNGSYSDVCAARHSQSGQLVAIKRTKLYWDRAADDHKNVKRVLREVHILRQLRHQNTVALLDILPPVNFENESFSELYLVFALSQTDLAKLMRMHMSDEVSLSDAHWREICYQMLLGLRFCHTSLVIHRDLKPGMCRH